MAAAPALRILAIWTRALDGAPSSGRVNVARDVRTALAQAGALDNARHANVLEHGAYLSGAAAFVRGLLTLRPLPLQCALFAPGPQERALAARAAGYAAVYADGVRTLLWLRRLRRHAPALHLVVDLDDLHSARCNELLAHRLPLSLGYLERLVPRGVVRACGAGRLARLVLRYERWALRRAEGELLSLADEVVLLNALEAAQLAARQPQARARVRTIPPCVSRPPVREGGAGGAWRAVFVGSDALVQNRLTIEYLEALWQRHAIAMPLVIYGARRGAPASVANVVCRGYAADIAEAYAPGSILVCPAFLRGGIKTKALEGFAHGVPVVGNRATFEGMRLGPYPLCLDDEAALVGLLRDPAPWAEVFARANAIARDYLAREHEAGRFAARWRDAVLPHTAMPVPAAPVP